LDPQQRYCSTGIDDAGVGGVAASSAAEQHIATITNDISCRSSAAEAAAAAAVAGCSPTEQHPEMWQMISGCRLARKQVHKSLDSQQLRAINGSYTHRSQLSNCLPPRCV